MFKRTTLLLAIAAAASAQRPFFSITSGGPPSSPFSDGPPSSFGGGGPSSSPFASSGGPPPFSSGGPSSSIFSSGPPSFGNGPPSSSPFSSGPLGRPGSRPPKGAKNSAGNKFFNWIGSTMSKLQGLGPKVHFHPAKPSKPSSPGASYFSSSPQSIYSSGGPPRDSLLNSLFEGSSSPFGGGGSTVTYSSPNSIEHAPVHYRNGPPPGFGSRPGPPSPSFASSRPPPSFSSRPPPSFSSGGPQSYSTFINSQARPSFAAPPSQNTRNNLEVYPSQQVSYQSETLSQNEPNYENALGSLQSLYGNQNNFRQNQQNPLNYEQQSSFSQNRPQQVAKNPGNNYGATFHSIEPVRVAPIYDVGQQFKPSSADMSGSASNVQQQNAQQPSNIHDTPFANIVNDYAAQADAATSGSEQMFSALQGSSDMATAASSNQGMQILGQGASPDGNPIFEVVADANAPTYDGHPVDLTRLISMIEPGAQIDTIPNYSDADMGASEQQPMYAQAPSNLEMESDAAMASGIMSGNKPATSKNKPFIIAIPEYNNDKFNSINEKLQALASESRPTVVKLDGTRLNDEQLIKEHFDKEIILDDLQGDKDHGFIIVGVPTDNETGDQDENDHLHGTDNNKNWTLIDNLNKNSNDKDDMLAIVQQLRNSASSVVLDSLKNDSAAESSVTPLPNTSNTTDSTKNEEGNTKTTHHPNHNYYPELSPTQSLDETESEMTPRDKLPVINPIVDSVRPYSFRDDASADDSSNSSHTPEVDILQDQLQLSEGDNGDDDDDDDQMFPDDMIVSEEGDLAASGSRNVKSVAIIVTPPPNYVKIRNKYKKAIIPLSAMTSSTTTTPPTTTMASNAHHEAFSESLASIDISSISENDQKSSISTSKAFLPSSLTNNNGDENDFISNARTISGNDSSQFSNTNSRASVETSKETRRYPVYRGRSNA